MSLGNVVHKWGLKDFIACAKNKMVFGFLGFFSGGICYLKKRFVKSLVKIFCFCLFFI